MENLKKFEVEEDLRQSDEYGKFMEKIGWRVVDGIFIKRLGPVSIAKIQRRRLPETLEKILRDNRVMMCKVEPVDSAECEVLRAKGFKADNWPLLGTKTLRVDLRPGIDMIMASFKKDARYCIRQATGLKPKTSINNYDVFYEIWEVSAKRKNLWIPPRREFDALVESFGKNVFCVTLRLLRFHSGQVRSGQAGALILLHKNAAFYYYAGATGVGNKQNFPYLVVWEAMKEAKKRGAGVWDFEGVYDARWPNKGWKGFSHFKKSFGGMEIEYPGCFVKWRWPF